MVGKRPDPEEKKQDAIKKFCERLEKLEAKARFVSDKIEAASVIEELIDILTVIVSNKRDELYLAVMKKAYSEAKGDNRDSCSSGNTAKVANSVLMCEEEYGGHQNELYTFRRCFCRLHKLYQLLRRYGVKKTRDILRGLVFSLCVVELPETFVRDVIVRVRRRQWNALVNLAKIRLPVVLRQGYAVTVSSPHS